MVSDEGPDERAGRVGPEEDDIVGVAAERFDVSLDPVEGGQLIPEAEIALLLVAFGRRCCCLRRRGRSRS